MERGHRLIFSAGNQCEWRRQANGPAVFVLRGLFFAQLLALRQVTTPSITFERPSSNFAWSTTSLDATASIRPMAEEAKDMAADFLSVEVEWPKSASIPCTMAGIKATPERNFARKFIDILLWNWKTFHRR